MKLRGPGVIASILSIGLAGSATYAGDTVHPICPLVLQQERVDRDERELAVDLATSQLAAAQSIFVLVDQLWEKEAVERIVYLAAKHERDVADIEVKRQKLLLKRQEAEVEQYASVCGISEGYESTADRRTRLREAHRKYLQADCHRIGKDLAIAEVDLAYLREVLDSVKNLRRHNVATAQDVIRAERDADMARKRVESQERRVQECIRSGAAAGNG